MSETSRSQPIFIVGYMHSGTTLLRKILGSHSAVFPIRAETMFYDQLSAAIPRRFPDLNDDQTFEAFVRFLIKKTRLDWPPVAPDEANELDAQFTLTEAQEAELVAGAQPYRDYAAAFRFIYDTVAELAGKPRWLEKTPSHVFHIDRILNDIPDALFIELVRDPRDILASKKIRKTTDWADRYDEELSQIMQVTKGYDPLRDSLGWKSAVQAGERARRRLPDKVMRVRYEDLVTTPETVVSDLCRFLNLAFEPAMLQVGWSNTTVGNGDARPKKGIDASAVSKWQRTLPAGAIALCQRVAGDEMIRQGYRLHPISAGDSVKMLPLVGRSAGDLMQRSVDLWRVRGADYVYGMLVNSARRISFLGKR